MRFLTSVIRQKRLGFVGAPFPCARRERFPFREAVIWEKALREVGTNAWVSDLRIWQIDTPTQFVVAGAPTERKTFSQITEP